MKVSLLSSLLASIFALPAYADQPFASDDAETLALDQSPRSHAREWMALDNHWEATTKLKFITTPDPVGGLDWKFSDVSLLRLQLKTAEIANMELSASLDLLAKETSLMDEEIVQRGAAGLRIQIKDGLAAFLGGDTRPWLGGGGRAYGGALGFSYRTTLNESRGRVRFQTNLGASALGLYGKNGNDDYWEANAFGQGILSVNCGRRCPFAGWVSAKYSLPIDHADQFLGMEPEANARLDATIGMVALLGESWDLAFSVSRIDRGDAENLSSTLPLLDGGFDQMQYLFTATRKFRSANIDEYHRDHHDH